MDIYTILTICFFPLVLLTLIVGAKVKINFNKYSSVNNPSGLTAAQVARRLLDENNLFEVRVVEIEGELTDNYNPSTQTVSLSKKVYGSTSVAAVSVAAHEVGHAIQHSQEYASLKIRNALVPVCNLTSKISMPLLLIGLLFELFLSYNIFSNILFFAGIICYAVYALFTLITLPVEFNASKRARTLLTSCGIVNQEDEKHVKKMLNSAAMTYVMSFAISILQLLRIILIFGRKNKD